MSQPAWLGLPEGQAVATALQRGRLDAAALGLRSLLERFPDEPSLLYNFAVVACDVGWLDEAADAYRRLAPASASLRPRAVAGLLRVAQLSGDFAAIEGAVEATVRFLDQAIEAIDDVQILKFFAYRRVFTPALDRFAGRLERRIAALLLPVRPAWPARRRSDGQMTIGYLSSGFGDHPIGHVARDLFAAHDRSGFRVLGFSGRDRSAEAAPFAAAIRAGFDAFHEIGELPPAAAAARIAAEGVEILISLDQHMDWRGATSATEILALRPAPVQVAWLGVAAGTGQPCVDYLLADAVTVPEGEEGLYAEAVLRLPGCYHCASPHAIAGAVPSRAECGLPETGIVFAGFNNIEKIERSAFEAWMAILRNVPESVLWLTNQRRFRSTEANLRREAAAHGVAGDRLVFAHRLPDKAAHLARHALADLLLDSFTINASTTALDALWAGLPVLTKRGDRFPARLSETFLRSLGLGELVAPDRDAFVRLAVALAEDAPRRAGLKARLRMAVATGTLFDIAGFARKLEDTYRQIRAAPV
jgi:predicted O-linked N-acetylglucosamine transferase (SPINDLY family)